MSYHATIETCVPPPGSSTAPLVVHILLRPIAVDVAGVDLPDIDQTCDIFAEAFIRAVAVQPRQEGEQQ